MARLHLHFLRHASIFFLALIPFPLIVVWDASPAAGAVRQTRPVVVTVRDTAFGRSIPNAFIGLSTEYYSLLAYTGADPSKVNPVFVRLVRALAPGQSATLRIGGDSADRTWWPERGLRRPAGVVFALSSRWLASVKSLLLATGARIIFDLNLEAQSPAVALAEQRHLVAGVGRHRVEAVEIGNEPEYYATFPWYRTATGQPVFGRGPDWNFDAYERDFLGVGRVLGALPLAGPATGSIGRWLPQVNRLLVAEPNLYQVTAHRYPLNRCVVDPTSPSYPTVSNLLSVRASRGSVDSIEPYVSLTHRHHRLFRVDEMNAVTCGGEEGVSDTFASALWMLDSLMNLAGLGVDGVNIHVWPGAPASQLFVFRHDRGRWRGVVRPAYYALLMFNRAAPAGARLLRVSSPGGEALRVWATAPSRHYVNVLLVNDSVTDRQTVVVRPPRRPSAAASLQRLMAPSVGASYGTTLAGQRVASGTTTGMLSGVQHLLVVKPSPASYRLTLPAASVALLTIPGQ